MDRRQFIKTSALAGAAMATKPIRASVSRHQDSTGFFGVHPFIENHPEAVFIMRTSANAVLDSPGKKAAGEEFGRSVIIPRESGVPLTSLIPIKPNIRFEHGWNVNVGAGKIAASEVQGYKGTDAFFVEGVIESLKELGISPEQIFIREVNSRSDGGGSGDYPAMAQRTGAELRYMGDKIGVIDNNDLVWVETPEGIWYRKIPYLWPINADNSWLLNIAKLKAHGMGLTLAAKNLQGSIAKNYQQHCTAYTSKMDMDYVNHINPNSSRDILDNYNRHKADGYPRWDKLGSATFNSGIGMETWASRCLDNNAATPCGLHIIEGIYAVDGNFNVGPHTDSGLDLTNPKGDSWELLTNYVIFGMNAFHVDAIGHWLGGHEPGNLGLLHMAIENGLSTKVNPMGIPVYEWKDGSAQLTPLTEFERTEVLTYYLQRDYDNQSENYWHLLDEPFEYSDFPGGETSVDVEPATFTLHQNHPNPFNPYTSIEFSLAKSGNARLEVYNSAGQLVDVLTDGYHAPGAHMATWNTSRHSTGVYFYRLRVGDFSETKKMTLLK